MVLRKLLTKELIKELGLPENSMFLGYIVHLPNEDEFLAEFISTEVIEKRLFVKTPKLAKVYNDHRNAIRDSKKCKQKAEVCLLFDVGRQFIVIPMGE